MGILTILKYLMIIILPFLILILALNLAGFDDFFYTEKFSEYGISQNVPNAGQLHRSVMDFLKGDSSQLPDDFNSREKQHLLDVKNLIRISTIVLYFLVALFVALLLVSSFTLKVNNAITNFVGKVLVFGGILTLALASALFLLVNSDFEGTFGSFHELFFRSGTYSFDPAREVIVNLYPEKLFMDLGLRISIWAVSAAAIVILLGSYFMFRPKSKKNK